MANTQNLDLVKPLGTDHALVSVLNSNSDKIDAYAGAVNASLDGLRDGLGILADGNTHAAVTSGQFVYVKNHQTLPQGLYQATTNIAANGTLSTSNLTADPKGGLNTLSEQIANVNTDVALKVGQTNPFKMVDADNGTPNINQMFSFTDSNTLNTPYKQGITNVTNQLIITLYGNNTYNTQIAVNIGGTDMYIRRRNTGGWSSWYQFAMSS